jgi:tRNA (guanine-N7-)-methyltransferase
VTKTEADPPVVEIGGPISPIEYVPPDYFRAMDLAQLFPMEGPLEVDLGCGDGSFLVTMALKHPERNYLGTERLFGRARNTCRKAERRRAANVRLLRVENTYVVKHLLPPATVGRFYVLFPDPWPKRRHWPRRLIQPEFLEAAATALAPGGELCIKTDDADYFAFIERTVEACDLFIGKPWNEDVPPTDFERHYAAQGRKIHSVCLTRRSPLTNPVTVTRD